jgi:hypothetical protein
MPVTLRTTEATSPTSGRKYLVSTASESWKRERFETTVLPIVAEKETITWTPYQGKWDNEMSAVQGHDRIVDTIKSGEIDEIMSVKSR